MIKKLTRHGNSSALVIDRAILDLLKIDQDTALDVSTDGKRLIIEPLSEAEQARRLRKSMDRVRGKYDAVFKRLAE